jgi:thiamine biosynthesis lipoprotein
MDTLLSPRRRALVSALATTPLLYACGPWRAASPALEFRGPTMGSTYTVKIAGASLSPPARTQAQDAVHAALSAVDAAMSTHRADSELSRFNRHGAATPFALSRDTFAVLALAQEVSTRTGGAFDVTVAPVVDAWGFGPGRHYRVVDALEIARLERRVGHDALALDRASSSAAKARPDVGADLSGIAKGFGIDRAAHALDALGLEHYMIEAGGEVRTRGRNAEGQPWRIAIEQPDAVPQRARRVVPLSGLSIATSGDYRIWFERDGRRYCHEIDPARGRPIDNGVASVSVVADDCAFADAMATALMVMGEARGLAFAAATGLAAHFIVREAGGRLRDASSPAFAALGAWAVPGV